MKKNLLISGSAGFIASNLIELLQNEYSNKYNLYHVDMLSDVSDKNFWDSLPSDNKHCGRVGEISAQLLERWKIDLVIHAAASSHVDNSIKDPLSFTNLNIVDTNLLFEACRQYGKIDKIALVSCYDENTRALTTDGFKTYAEIKIGDKVLSINPDNGKIEEKEVLEVIVQDYEGEMVQFDNNNSNSCVTPNHKVFYRNTAGKIIWREAKDILNKSLGYLLTGEFGGIKSGITYVDGIGNVNTDALFYICGIFAGDGFLATQTQRNKTKSGLCKVDKDKIRDKNGRFVKFDSPAGNHVSEVTCYRIFWDIPEKDKARKKLEESFDKLGIKYSKHDGKAGQHLYFSSKEWSKFFEQFGKGFINKNIPDWMKKYDKKHLRHLFDGLIDSDGHYRKSSGPCFSTSSPKLLSDICEIGIKLGYVASFSERKNIDMLYKKENRRIKSKHIGYMVYFKNNSKYNFFQNKYLKQYSGKIWCLKVADNKNFVTERYGKLRICGNTDEVLGSLGPNDNPFIETDPFKPNSPYSASKACQEMLARAYVETYGLPIVVTRCSNNYGPRQANEKLIPKAVECLMSGNKIPIYGNGLNVRDWIHTEDHCRGIISALEKGLIGQTYHFGGNSELSNLELIDKIIEVFYLVNCWCYDPNNLTKHVKFVKDRLGHDQRYAMNYDKAFHELNWHPTYSFANGIYETVKWYMKNNKNG